MRLMLTASKKPFIRRYRLKNSLLPFWVYWPQKILFFSLFFVKDFLVGFIKDHILYILMALGFIIIGHQSIQQLTQASSSTGAWITQIVEIASIVLFILATFARTSVSQIKRKKKDRTTYSRKEEVD